MTTSHLLLSLASLSSAIVSLAGLQLEELSSPAHLVLGQSASLVCNYNLANSSLYSLKWYKNGQEFFRFMPSLARSFEVFHVVGVNLDVSDTRQE